MGAAGKQQRLFSPYDKALFMVKRILPQLSFRHLRQQKIALRPVSSSRNPRKKRQFPVNLPIAFNDFDSGKLRDFFINSDITLPVKIIPESAF